MLTDEERRELHKRGIEGFVKDGVVDWENIEKLREDMRKGTYTEEFYNEILEHLLDFGIFSSNPNGNFILAHSSGLNLNPSFFSHIYFTKEEDAKKHKTTRYGRAQYPVSIWKISVIE